MLLTVLQVQPAAAQQHYTFRNSTSAVRTITFNHPGGLPQGGVRNVTLPPGTDYEVTTVVDVIATGENGTRWRANGRLLAGPLLLGTSQAAYQGGLYEIVLAPTPNRFGNTVRVSPGDSVLITVRFNSGWGQRAQLVNGDRVLATIDSYRGGRRRMVWRNRGRQSIALDVRGQFNEGGEWRNSVRDNPDVSADQTVYRFAIFHRCRGFFCAPQPLPTSFEQMYVTISRIR